MKNHGDGDKSGFFFFFKFQALIHKRRPETFSRANVRSTGEEERGWNSFEIRFMEVLRERREKNIREEKLQTEKGERKE
jgi:hypothetical protein